MELNEILLRCVGHVNHAIEVAREDLDERREMVAEMGALVGETRSLLGQPKPKRAALTLIEGGGDA